MFRVTRTACGIGGFMSVLLLPLAAWAQQASGIGGQVKDVSGAVLPGVTVEASSPVLIEKVRTAVTDGDGRYRLVDLRPGTYVVTYSLEGFSALKREGIVLTAGFTAEVDVELRVGTLAETVTVSGQSPLVDVQTVRQQTSVSDEVLDTLPSGQRNMTMMMFLTPGFGASADVGGSTGIYGTGYGGARFHGKPQVTNISFDGLRVNGYELPGGGGGHHLNPDVVEEITLETSGALAESNSSGVVINSVPKEGGNTFRGSLAGLFGNDSLQSSNMTDELVARGFLSPGKVFSIWEVSGTLGGPIKEDRLWFFGAVRQFGNRLQRPNQYYNTTQGTPFYTPDLERGPGDRSEDWSSYALRLTWQASPRNKISAFADVQENFSELPSSNSAAEAYYRWTFSPISLFQARWTSPLTSRLLLESGFSASIFNFPSYNLPGVSLDDISILNRSTGFRYNSGQWTLQGLGHGGPRTSNRFAEKVTLSYVTGSHALKAGFGLEQGYRDFSSTTNGSMHYVFLGLVPSAVQQFATPWRDRENYKAELGLFVQDQWTIDRLTLNLGLRFDYYNAYVPEQHVPAGTWVPERNFDAVYDVPSWKDLNPRLGASYDLFGNGRTAVKVNLGRYLGRPLLDLTIANNPMVRTIDNVERTWNDFYYGAGDPRSGNYVPDCDLANGLENGECGAFSNQNFGKLNPLATVYADDIMRGFGVRDYYWDVGAEVAHQLFQGVSVSAGYFRNWHSNFSVTDNLAVTPEDFSTFCVTAPIDPKLPSGGGYPVCGLYDVAPTKFGQVTNLVTQASHFGKQTLVNDFFSVNVRTSLGSGIEFGGGVDTGRSVADNCYVVDSPQQLLYCRVVTPFSAQTQFKVHGSYPLPYGVVVSGVFQSVPGPNILANWAAPNSVIQPELGRPLAACGTRVPCTATATIPLVAPQTLFEDRRSQLNLRITKLLGLGGTRRLRASVDVYNALNANDILTLNNSYSATAWQRPLSILDARLIEFSASLTF